MMKTALTIALAFTMACCELGTATHNYHYGLCLFLLGNVAIMIAAARMDKQ